MIKTLAELKRYLQPGVELLCLRGGLGEYPPEKQRRIVKYQTAKAVAFSCPHLKPEAEMWLDFIAAKHFTFTETGFEVQHGDRLLIYKYVEKEQPNA